ncbi:molybdenum cofactor biosynthesis protein MoaE [Nocardioides sp. AE5]|uniref:molybdenum cofactor biosynthesis protein MoaE n=1 Tax=Nocardioides sp. AE5 TaxID=2962573 RepID=UPI0028818111|nr:molybdenum cofactor biosynthesis protein MoaE [Nocardioides sp. AE5]MDT0203874.1 molybdenum cofactor biosynthesis protein MoaE [Nocardioides sp. AE5]
MTWGPTSAVRLVGIREEPLSVEEMLAAVDDAAAGGVVLFVGRVRDHDGGKAVGKLEYAAHPSATERLAQVCASVADDHEGVVLAAVHRTGSLAIGDAAVIVAAAAAHRDLAFTASRVLIDRLKAEVPIWKHQVFADGTEEWVGSP